YWLLAAASGAERGGEGGGAAPGVWFTECRSGVEVNLPGSQQGSGPGLWSRLGHPHGQNLNTSTLTWVEDTEEF
ncbi:unnamed protein product, partial [Arctogadus glacialis]